MGPIKSRPFTFALHSLVGIGFLGGTFLVRPFLPNDEKNEDNSDKIICDAKTNQSIDDNEEITKHAEELLWGVAKIAWPFLISGTYSGFLICRAK